MREQSSGIWLGGNHRERPASGLPREAQRAPVGSASASALARFGGPAGTRARRAAGNSAIPFPRGAALLILELAEPRPPKLCEPGHSPLLERSNRLFCPEEPARPPSSDSRYSGCGLVTFRVACFPEWSVHIRMRASVFIAQQGR